MGVLLARNKFSQQKKGSGVSSSKENPNKFNSVPSGIIGQNNILTGAKPTIASQQQKPTTSVVSYGNDMLKQINFRKEKDKRVKLRI